MPIPTTSPNVSLDVASDIKKLIKVVVHRPDPGIEWVTPSNAESLLYDDIVFLPQMMKQHNVLVEILQVMLGEDSVLEFQNLLAELLKDEDLRQELLDLVVDFEEVPQDDEEFLRKLPPVSLAASLISGIVPGLHRPILPPLPNHIFTRDIGVTIKNSFLTCLASKKPRMRESILTWYVSHYHPAFQASSNGHLDLCKTPQELLEALRDPQLAIEGGDVMVIDEDNVFIGCSERTNAYTIERVADLLFEHQMVSRITLIDIPKLPTCIHLDTLFTQISNTDFVYYEPYLGADQKVTIKQFRDNGKKTVGYTSLKELLSEIQPQVQLIPCGNGLYPYAEREQYASGCNFVALKNGVAVSYARNLKTLDALRQHGYRVVDAELLLERIANGKVDPHEIQKTIITVHSSELVRAGGGPHCLTLPLIRG